MQSLNSSSASESELFHSYCGLFIDWQYMDNNEAIVSPVVLLSTINGDPTASEFGLIRKDMQAAEKRHNIWKARQERMRRAALERLYAKLAVWDSHLSRFEALPTSLILARKLKYRVVGRMLSKFHGTNAAEIAAEVNDAGYIGVLFDVVGRNLRFTEFRRFFCTNCGGFSLEPMEHPDENTHICSVCRDSVLVYSSIEEKYIYRSNSLRYYHDEESFTHAAFDYVSREYSEGEGFIRFTDFGGYGAAAPMEMYEYLDAEGLSQEGSPIGGYHSSKGLISKFITGNSPLPYLGVELEMESYTTSARLGATKVLKHLGFLTHADGKKYRYCATERDGSLQDGFEMVTAPCTLDVHRAHLSKLPLATEGLKSHDTSTCGLHVHVDREGTTPLHRGKMVYFINAKANEALVSAVARRYKRGLGYAKLKDKKLLDGATKSPAERYEAVNLTNRHTIEFRIFRGTLRYESVMACLEFAHSVWHFTREAGFNELNVKHFLAWIDKPQNKQSTSCLRQILFEKKLFDVKRPPLRETSPAPAGEE